MLGGSPRRWRAATRLALNALRSIPELVWAALLLISAGLGPFPGTLALALHTAGVLGRLFAESIENAAAHSNASSVVVELAEQDGAVVVSIRDDGQGGAAVRPPTTGIVRAPKSSTLGATALPMNSGSRSGVLP